MTIKVPLLETEKDFEALNARMNAIFQRDRERSVNGERKYHSSWRRRGGTGAYENIARKFDRISAASERTGNDVFQAVKANCASDGTVNGKDSLLDDFRDLRIYLALVEDYILNLEPEQAIGEAHP